VVIEQFLEGEEASFMVLVDGTNILALASSQDHKRLLDGDLGPNTGGMGAYSPAPVVSPAIHAKVMREIIRPTVSGMARDGIPFTGFLYAGLMISATGDVKTLEFNCRMGDPETQPVVARIKSDLVPIFEAAIDGKLDGVEIQWDRRTALGVVLAAANYPDEPRSGDEISGLGEYRNKPGADVLVFHAGTSALDKSIRTSGGRVLCVTALGDSVRMAQQSAYAAIKNIRFEGMQFRQDIGNRGLTRNR
jgi:phosphoribosylamine---glycine ligase